MLFVIGRVFANVQILIKLVLSLEPFGIFGIHIDIDKLQPKVLLNVIFIRFGRGFTEVKNLKIKWLAISLE